MAKISFELQESEELRKAMREVIMGQMAGTVKDMVREEIQFALAETINQNIPSPQAISNYANAKMKDEVEGRIKLVVSGNKIWEGSQVSKQAIRNMVVEILVEWMTDPDMNIKRLIEKVANERKANESV